MLALSRPTSPIVARTATVVVKLAVAAHLCLLIIQSSVLGSTLLPHALVSSNLLHVGLIATPIGVVAILGLWRNTGKTWRAAALLTILYGFIVGLTSLLSGTEHSASYISQLFLVPATIFSLCLCTPLAMERKDFLQILWLLAAILTAHSLLTFWFMIRETHYFLGHDITSGAGRAKQILGFSFHHTDGLYTNANTIGSFLMFFPAILISEAARVLGSASPQAARRRVLPAVAFCLALICTAVALTFSRGAQLTVLAGLLFPAIALATRAPWKSAGSCAALVVLALFVITPPGDPATETLTSSLTMQSSAPITGGHERLSGRLEIWKALGSSSLNTPLTGVGLMCKSYRGLSPHNFLLANFLYFGAGGLLALLALLLTLASALVSVIRQHHELIPIAGILAASCLLHGQFEYVLTYPLFFSNSIFWFLAGYACFVRPDKTAKTPVVDRAQTRAGDGAYRSKSKEPAGATGA